jgi:hypothetical protein
MPSEAEIEAAADALSKLLNGPPAVLKEAAQAALEAAERVRALEGETGDIAG